MVEIFRSIYENGDQAIKRIVSILKNNICSKVEKINVAI